jgi:hypothetical protein
MEAGESVGVGSGVYRGEVVEIGGGSFSMVVPNAVFPVGEPASFWK